MKLKEMQKSLEDNELSLNHRNFEKGTEQALQAKFFKKMRENTSKTSKGNKNGRRRNGMMMWWQGFKYSRRDKQEWCLSQQELKRKVDMKSNDTVSRSLSIMLNIATNSIKKPMLVKKKKYNYLMKEIVILMRS